MPCRILCILRSFRAKRVHQPGFPAQGKVCRHPVNSPDRVELFCREAGVTLPWKTQGRDIRPLLRDPETTAWNSPMLLTHTGRCYGADTDVIPTDSRLPQSGHFQQAADFRLFQGGPGVFRQAEVFLAADGHADSVLVAGRAGDVEEAVEARYSIGH